MGGHMKITSTFIRSALKAESKIKIEGTTPGGTLWENVHVSYMTPLLRRSLESWLPGYAAVPALLRLQ